MVTWSLRTWKQARVQLAEGDYTKKLSEKDKKAGGSSFGQSWKDSPVTLASMKATNGFGLESRWSGQQLLADLGRQGAPSKALEPGLRSAAKTSGCNPSR